MKLANLALYTYTWRKLPPRATPDTPPQAAAMLSWANLSLGAALWQISSHRERGAGINAFRGFFLALSDEFGD